MRVTKTNFSHVHAAFVEIERDNGFHHFERIQGRDCNYDKRTYLIPVRYQNLVVIANATLEVMTEEERETVCVGEATESEEIIKSYDSDGKVVEKLLCAFFDAWLTEETEE